MLHVFASQGHIVNVTNYVEKHVRSVEDLNYNLQTPLHVAAAYGRLEVVQYLLVRGNSARAVLQRDRWGDTPLDLAIRGHFYDCAALLLHHAPPAHLAPPPQRPAPLVDVSDASYQLLLLIAQPNAADASPPQTTITTSKPPPAAAAAPTDHTLPAIAQLLDLLSETVHADNIVDAERRTPAHLAAACGKLAVLELLHSAPHHCTFSSRDRHGRTALDEAKRFKHEACVDFLEECVSKPALSLEELHDHGVDQGWAYEERTVAFRVSPDVPGEGKFFKLPCVTKALQRVELEYQALKSSWQDEIETIAKLRHPFIQGFYGTSLLTVPHPLMLFEQPVTTLDKLLTERALNHPVLAPAPSASSSSVDDAKRHHALLLPGDQQRRVLSQIALALLYLHAHGIVYRSLDANHVLVFSPELCKLQVPPTQSILEDKEYRFMAPELVRATTRREYLPTCDMYSFAMVAFWLFSGKRPFREEREVKDAVRRGVRPDINDVPNESMRAIIATCWDEDPLARLTIHEVLQRFDATWATAGNSVVPPPSPKSVATAGSGSGVFGAGFNRKSIGRLFAPSTASGGGGGGGSSRG